MANITAADVSKLRQMTGAGMMDCKKALVEAEGDFERAKELIRERGLAIANKRADREASEGVVLTKLAKDNTAKKTQRGIPKREYKYIGLRIKKGVVTLEENPRYCAFITNK